MDLHCEMMLEEYQAALPELERLLDEVLSKLRDALTRNEMLVTAVEGRVKTRTSLEGKLALKGGKYATLSDITDLVGARIVTFYTDDVDRIASMVEQLFEIDWQNSVDKRKLHDLDSFGYNSLHYVCTLPGYSYRFELQLRTTLQHVWATINHDIGYKTGVEIPREYLRRINRLSGLLEMADDEFSRIRTEITDYRRRVHALVQNGKLDDVQLDGDTFHSYLLSRPFDRLNKRIAALNQAEIEDVPLMQYLKVFKELGCKTLGDVQRLVVQHSENAYRLARHQLGNTDLDILSSAVGVQNICIVCILAMGGGKIGLVRLFNLINGHNTQNDAIAELTYEQAKNIQLL